MKGVNDIDWQQVGAALDARGYAHLPAVLDPEECTALINGYSQNSIYRNIINMQRYRFGKGEYKYFNYPLPATVARLRETYYPPLAAVANAWMNKLGIALHYPPAHAGLLDLCHQKNQTRPTPLILRYEKGGYNTLHQDLYGDVYFPFQMVFVLNESGKDFTGGEFVLVEQVPRAQSRAQVIQLRRGDALIFTTHFRPASGIRGYYRAAMKHGISEVTSGERYAMGIIFHDAT